MRYASVSCTSDRFHHVYLETFGNETLTSIEDAVVTVSCVKLYLLDMKSVNCIFVQRYSSLKHIDRRKVETASSQSLQVKHNLCFANFKSWAGANFDQYTATHSNYELCCIAATSLTSILLEPVLLLVSS